MEAAIAIASVIPFSSIGISCPTNVRSASTLFNVKGLLNLKHQTDPGRSKTAFGLKKTIVKASASDDESYTSGWASPTAPLWLESPTGKLLSEILMSQPDLLHTAVEWQLERLQRERDAEEHKEESSASALEPSLYRRIAEVKRNERKKAVEEILYVMVVQKFMDAKVDLIPRMTTHCSSGQVENWESLDGELLKQLHSPEAYKMIMKHLALIFPNLVGDSTKVTRMSKLMVRRVYGGYVVNGYFTKGLDVRFQLEKKLKEEENAFWPYEDYYSIDSSVESEAEPEPEPEPEGGGGKLSPLGSYAKSIDSETLTMYTRMRSEEAVSITQKQTQALLGGGGEEDGDDDDMMIKMSMGGMKRLILEAVTFGSLLWEAEIFVDSRLPFLSNYC